MVVDFNALDYRDGPLLILKNLDGTPIQPLGFAHSISAKLMYNEVSELSFEIPAYSNGHRVPHYDDVVGMRIVDLAGVGQFILSSPKVESDGIKEYKQCTAYSLEYELTYKKIFIAEGTYNFWNPVAREDTVIGMILELFPSWGVGVIDENLWGKYRTFSVDNDSAYDFIKGTLQETYQCIFDFDTYNRKINVRSISSSVETQPILLSLDNLIKEISIEEDTENIFTCLDVNGADGVDIRSVNPLGTNKIYNLDYFMVPEHVSQKMIDQWNSWKQTYENHQRPYFDVTIEKTLEESRLETARATLMDMEGVLQKYETLQSAYVESAAQGIDRSKDLADIKKKISAQKDAIRKKKGEISEIQTEIDTLYETQKKMNADCSLSSFFSPEELILLDRYIKEDAISEESFVYRSVASYTEEDIAESVQKVSADISKASITKVKTATNKEIYSILNGSIVATVDEKQFSAAIIRAAIEKKVSGEYVLTAYLGGGSYDKTAFPGGCISLVGSDAAITTDVKPNPDIEGEYFEGTSLSLASSVANLYFTMNTTEYAKRSIEWDLYEYGQECLRELCYPSYTFSVEASNFLALDEFSAFKRKFKLGDKIYLELDSDKHLSPIVIGAEIEFDDPSKFSLLFGDKYSASDSAFELVDLLEQSVSMGKTVASNKTNYNSFIESGASTSVKDFISSALDVAKNKVLSSTGQSIQWDASGLRLRKQAEGAEDYDPEQVWMINNSIVFTDDGWTTAKMAIGKFVDENTGVSWGVVAPALVGTILAGSNLVIESAKQSGETAVFRVDANGAQLHNARFDLIKGDGQINLYPETGLVGGSASLTSPLFMYDELGEITGVASESGKTLTSVAQITKNDLPNANFWLDMEGNAYFKGKVFATDGEFTGTIHAKDGDFSGTLNAAKIIGGLTATDGSTLKGISLGIGPAPNYDNFTVDRNGNLNIGKGNFMVDSSGNVTMRGGINLNGAITWGTAPVQYQFSVNKTNWHSTMTDADRYRRDSLDGGKTWGPAYQFRGVDGQDGLDGKDGSDANVPSYVKETYIDFSQVRSPKIIGNEIITTGHFAVSGDVGGTSGYMGYMGAAYGLDANDNTTYGVAFSYGDPSHLRAGDKYLIVTSGGVRMQAGDNEVTVTPTSINLNTASGRKAYYNGVEINTGGGSTATVRPVWG